MSTYNFEKLMSLLCSPGEWETGRFLCGLVWSIPDCIDPLCGAGCTWPLENGVPITAGMSEPFATKEITGRKRAINALLFDMLHWTATELHTAVVAQRLNPNLAIRGALIWQVERGRVVPIRLITDGGFPVHLHRGDTLTIDISSLIEVTAA